MEKPSLSEPTLHDVLDAVNDFATHVEKRFDRTDLEIAAIKETMTTKLATKEDLAALKSEIVSEIDRFVVLHQKTDHEVAALQSRCGRIETFVGMKA